MGTLTTVTGSAWPTSGAASAGTSGLNTITGGTHVGSTDVPAGSAATGYIRGADNAALNVRIDPTTIPMQTNGTDYWVSMWWRFQLTATTLVADLTACQLNIFQNAGTKLRLYLYVRNLTHNPGLGIAAQEFLTGGTAESLFSTGSSGSPPIIAFGQWVHLTLHVSRSTAAGVYEIYCNGILIQRQSALPTDGEVTAAQLQAQPNLSWPATNGIRAEVCGPIISYDGAGPALRPMHSLWPSTALIAQAHTVDMASDVSNSNGKCWTYTGTATRALVVYSAAGSTPARKRWSYTGSGVTWNQTTIDALGAVPYNERGWATLVFPMLYVPDGSGQIVLRNSGGSAILTLDVTSGQLQKGGVNQAAWDQADRYCLMIHIGSAGSLTGSLYDLTENNTAQNAWSFDLGSWTPAALGTVTVSGTTGTLAAECDGAWLYRWAPVAGVDSLSNVAASTVTPSMSMVNHVSSALAAPADSALVPNAAYPNRVWGMPARPIACVAGRSGQTRALFQTNVLDQLGFARGLEVVNCDGGSVNDLTTVSDVSTQTSKLESLQTLFGTMCDQGFARDWRVWLTTMLRRPTGGTWTTIQIETMDLLSAQIRATAAAKQSANLHLRLSDPANLIADHPAQYTVPADYTHPTATGSGEIAKQMVVGLSTPDAPVVGASSVALGSVTGSATGTASSATVTGASSATLDAVTGTAAGTSPVAGASSATLGAFTGSATGTAAIVLGTSNVAIGAITGSGAGISGTAPVVSASQLSVTARRTNTAITARPA